MDLNQAEVATEGVGLYRWLANLVWESKLWLGYLRNHSIFNFGDQSIAQSESTEEFPAP